MTSPPTTVRLQNIAQSYGQSAALMAAVEIGVFTAISNGAGTYEEVARAVDIHPTNAERLMVMLCAAGLLEKAEGRHTQRRRRRALPGRGQARLHGPLDHLHQAAVDRVGPARPSTCAPRTSR